MTDSWPDIGPLQLVLTAPTPVDTGLVLIGWKTEEKRRRWRLPTPLHLPALWPQPRPGARGCRRRSPPSKRGTPPLYAPPYPLWVGVSSHQHVIIIVLLQGKLKFVFIRHPNGWGKDSPHYFKLFRSNGNADYLSLVLFSLLHTSFRNCVIMSVYEFSICFKFMFYNVNFKLIEHSSWQHELIKIS